MSLAHFLFGTTVGQWLLALVVVLLLGLVVRLLGKLSLLLGAAADRAAAEHRSAVQVLMLRAGDILTRCAADAVAYIEQTVRPQILGAAKDGKLDEEQAKALKDAAIKMALEQARVQFGKALEQVGASTVGDFQPTIEHLIELLVEKIAGNSRMSGTAPVPVSVVPVAVDPQAPSA
jgi:hypothetical protein